MHRADWIALGILVAVALAVATQQRAWRAPRRLGLIALFTVVGVLIGAVFGLALGVVASIWSAAIWIFVVAIVAFELHRWRRRHRSS